MPASTFCKRQSGHTPSCWRRFRAKAGKIHDSGRAWRSVPLNAPACKWQCAAFARATARRHATQQAAPLLQALLDRGARRDAPFHIPGHKRGADVHPLLAELLSRPLQHDLTELPGLDYLSTPTGVIHEAQQLAAAAFGADRTFFLVNGTTVGVQAVVLATCGPGQTLLVARNCHACAFSAMVLAGCSARYMYPAMDPDLGIPHAVTPAALEASFQAAEAAGDAGNIGAVLLVSPTYFGVSADMEGLARVCHARGVPLVVDAAHGAHFAFHAAFPPCPLAAGADAVVHSTHKTLTALGQASMLHLCGARIDGQRVAHALQMLQSSSPSYLLLASLDAARAHAQRVGAFDEALAAAADAATAVAGLPSLDLLRARVQTGTPEVHAMDPLRLSIVLSGLDVSGYDLDLQLDRDFGICAEMSTSRVLVLALGQGSKRGHATPLRAALKTIATPAGAEAHWPAKCAPLLASSDAGADAVLTPREAFYARSTRVPFNEALSRVSAELLCPYPPGVPVAFPGERLDAGTLQMLRDVLAGGGKVTGAADPQLETIAVVD